MKEEMLIQDQETRQWAMLLHLSQLAGFVIPFGGLILPILIWQLKKEDMPELDIHGKVVANWIISETIYTIVSIVLAFVVVGIFLLIPLSIIAIVFPIMGAVKANEGQIWKYPLSISFL